MDNEEAKFLLSACRPCGGDADRTEVAEALAKAQRDPELADWLARERRLDAAIARKLRELEPSAALRARLLAGGRASHRARNWHAWRASLSIAAAVVCTAGIGWMSHALFFSPPAGPTAVASLQQWQDETLRVFRNPFFSLDLKADDYEPLERHLLAHDARVAGELPFGDAIVSAVGCKVLQVRGATVSLTCFRSDTGELVHLFVGVRSEVTAPGLQDGPVRTQVGDFATVSWLRGDIVVMVASKLPAEQLERTLLHDQLAAFAIAVTALTG